MVEKPEKELEIKHKSRETELQRRKKELRYWMQRDSRRAKVLKNIWAERDKLYFSESRRIFEYVCTVCNRPYTTPRKLPPQNTKRCYTCTAFMRRKMARDYNRRNPDKVKEQNARRKLPKTEVKTNLSPEVVWQDVEES